MMKYVLLNVYNINGRSCTKTEWIENHVEFGMQEDQSILDNTEVQILDTEE